VITEKEFNNLGWVRDIEDDRMWHISFTLGECTLHYCDEDNEIVITSLHPKVINFDKVIFIGTIDKAKDLKTLMGWLNIVK